jgi:two-component system LytT family response regulator
MRAMIVDDEPLARQRLRELLAELPNITIVAECEDGEQAINAIGSDGPDLVFLDISMPGLNGFEVLQALDAGHVPQVIFTTAYDEHALRAFEAHAVDYLLKPIDPQRLRGAVERAELLLRGSVAAALPAIADVIAAVAGPRFTKRIAVRRGDRMLIVAAKEIDWIEASGNYIRLHIGDRSDAVRATMNSMESELDPAQFARIHRQTIVNVDRIVEVSAGFGGDYFVVLRSGLKLVMQRSYLEHLRAAISRL